MIFISHNPQHAYTVGDRFFILKHGKVLGSWTKKELSLEDMIRNMSGVDELEALSRELEQIAGRKDP